MASLIYDSYTRDAATGSIVWGTDTLYVMLVTSTYTPNKKTHTKRSDVTNEVSGTGYVAGGKVLVPTLTLDTTNDRYDITFADVTWATSTITAHAGVLHKHRGGASSADELIAYADFGADTSTTGGTFTMTFTGPLRYQN